MTNKDNEHMFSNSPAVDALQVGVHRLTKVAINHADRLDALEINKEQHHKANEKLIEVLKDFEKRISTLEDVDNDNDVSTEIADEESNCFENEVEAYDIGFKAGYIAGVCHCEAGIVSSKDLETKYEMTI